MLARTAPLVIALTSAALVLCSVACSDASDRGALEGSDKPSQAGPAPGGGAATFEGTGGGTTSTKSGASCEKMDILFVVDNSGSMGEEQSNLATNFALVTGRLDAYTTGSGGKLDYRIAVTTTGRSYTDVLPSPLPISIGGEKGDDGAFRRGCGLKGAWIEKGDADRSKELSCAANVGTDGPGLEMPLDALRLAVTERETDGKNAGFLRSDALLAVVIITDEDDCSHVTDKVKDACNANDLKPLSTFLSTLDQVKGGRERWAAAVIAGETTCNSTFGTADEAKRLKDFVSQTGKNAIFRSICQGDLVKPLEDALNVFGDACQHFSVK